MVDASGRVQKIFEGNKWTSQELVAEMLKGRRRGQTSDGLICRDHLENSADGSVRTVIVERTDGPAALAGFKVS